MISEKRFGEDLIEKYLEARYERPVVTADVPHPFGWRGDPGGLRPERGGVGLHSPPSLRARRTTQRGRPGDSEGIGANLPESRLAEIERAACVYSLPMLHAAGVRDLDQWLSDFATCELHT